MQNQIYFGYDLLPESTLEHYGMPRRSGRYPWGSGEDPYHHGASAPGGRQIERRGGNVISRFRKKRQAAKQAESDRKRQAEENERKAVEAEDKARRESEKKAAIASGDPRRIADHISEMSTAELNDALARANALRNLNDLEAKANPAAKSRADIAIERLDKANKFASTGIDTWNNVAKIYNAFNGDEDDLPLITNKVFKNDKPKSLQTIADKAKKQIADSSNKKVDTPSAPESKSQLTSDDRKDFRRGMAEDFSKQLKNQQASEARKDFRRGMAEEYSKQLKSRDDEVLDEKWRQEARDIVSNAKNEARKDFRREMAEDYSRGLKEQSDSVLRDKWRSEANDITNQAKNEARKDFRRERASEYSDYLKTPSEKQINDAKERVEEVFSNDRLMKSLSELNRINTSSNNSSFDEIDKLTESLVSRNNASLESGNSSKKKRRFF